MTKIYNTLNLSFFFIIFAFLIDWLYKRVTIRKVSKSVTFLQLYNVAFLACETKVVIDGKKCIGLKQANYHALHSQDSH